MSVFISLTTVPDRMKHWNIFKDNIDSLLNQNYPDYKVLLNIPKIYGMDNIPYDIPKELQELANTNNKLIINRLDEDFGPTTKIIGALKFTTNPEDVLVVCDDDHVYHPEMINAHLAGRARNPGCAIAFRGDVPIEKRTWTNEKGEKKFVLLRTHGVWFPVICDTMLAIPGHWHSVSYTRKFFVDSEFMDAEFLKKSDNDDILAGFYMKSKKIPVVCIFHDNFGDLRPVSKVGRDAHSFPIVRMLPFPPSGFARFREKAKGCYGFSEDSILNFVQDQYFHVLDDNL